MNCILKTESSPFNSIFIPVKMCAHITPLYSFQFHTTIDNVGHVALQQNRLDWRAQICAYPSFDIATNATRTSNKNGSKNWWALAFSPPGISGLRVASCVHFAAYRCIYSILMQWNPVHTASGDQIKAIIQRQTTHIHTETRPKTTYTAVVLHWIKCIELEPHAHVSWRESRITWYADAFQCHSCYE